MNINNENIIFLCGFPRAGTTLISNILAENNIFHVTPTSGLIEDFKAYRNTWSNNKLHNVVDENYIYPKIQGMLKGMLYGFHSNEIDNGKIIIEKNRSWVSEIDLLEELLGKKIKIIYPMRHIADILISMEKLKRKSKVNSYGDMGNGINELSTIGRAHNLLSKQNFVGQSIEMFREIVYRNQDDRLFPIVYDSFLTKPKEILKELYKFLELDYFDHDLKNIKQYTKESDLFHGYTPNSLHTINEGILLPPKKRDLTIYDKGFISDINKEYEDITEIINMLK